MNKDAKIINERIDQHFKCLRNHMYHIDITNMRFAKQYNFFICDQPRGKRAKSIPLHFVENYDLEYLEKVIQGVREHTQLTMIFTGFADSSRWPSNDRLSQRFKRAQE
ncbi:acetyl-CoA carboxyl transferase [Lacticaseibacillus paracasei]|uniref:acetyl-CoA carboxyl transferase n=1 Tax=Lacticaseibacillus paracasei TaxID=1597 RepID=UPI001C465D36|nr:acetyl-CoA carboxyl transferase [Lacticaseibacillus paracasei]QXJ68573.1 acetyl-CoA carboxyl transferase [Lacticaseibacillus paracasei subsp. paracasei]